MPFIGIVIIIFIWKCSHQPKPNQPPLLAERRSIPPNLPNRSFQPCPAFLLPCLPRYPVAIFNETLKGSKSSIALSLLPKKLEAWEFFGNWKPLFDDFSMIPLPKITDSIIHGYLPSPFKPLQRLQRSLSAFHELSLKMDHSLGLTLRGDLSSMDTSGIGMSLVMAPQGIQLELSLVARPKHFRMTSWRQLFPTGIVGF